MTRFVMRVRYICRGDHPTGIVLVTMIVLLAGATLVSLLKWNESPAMIYVCWTLVLGLLGYLAVNGKAEAEREFMSRYCFSPGDEVYAILGSLADHAAGRCNEEDFHLERDALRDAYQLAFIAGMVNSRNSWQHLLDRRIHSLE